MTQNSGFDEKARMTDLLNSEKHMTSAYNTFLCESETGEVRNCLAGLLNDEHAIKNEIFEEMSSKGYYKTEKAEETKISAAKQQFASMVKS
ncbi:MAG: spore coat protein [Clostridia bacterium]|nr:spore coat protein [Clostridia bacterium]